jgi:anti-sigma factor (TIGR02949 family)
MKCSDVRPRLGAWLDGELSDQGHEAIDSHLATCEACAEASGALIALGGWVREWYPREAAPEALRSRVQAAVRAEYARLGAGTARPRSRVRRLTTVALAWRWSGVAVAGLAVAILAWMPSKRAAIPGGLQREAVADHVRSLMASHLTDVATSDRHTVKPWFNGRLDFSPPVPDLDPQGFPLVGGRLDYLGGRTVAALVYARRKHVINAFLWPAPSGASPANGEAERNGYHVIRTRAGHMECWIVSDLAIDELRAFSAAFVGASAAPASGELQLPPPQPAAAPSQRPAPAPARPLAR